MNGARFHLRVPPVELAEWKRAAAQARMPLAAYIRRAVRIQVEAAERKAKR